ncbi:MAG: murein biosynthesis integral membrane protein MurJ [Simkania sp.]|nr:murein biosynthesis integral membrane protein MurJ [Simkania sp.]
MSKHVSRSAVRFSIGTLFSRVSGMAREMTMAFVLGTSPAVAAFLVAFRFAYLLRRLFGEGALVNGFIPHYEELNARSETSASFFFRDLLASLAVILLGLIGSLELGLLASVEYLPLQESNVEIMRLIMLSLPGLLFICLSALHSGFLQCQGRFFLTGIAPVAFNLAWIGTLFFYRHEDTASITVHLAIALDLAFLFQWVILLPATWKKLKHLLSIADLRSFQLFSPEIRRMLTAISLSVIGVSAIQINSFIDVLFARTADLEGPAYLTYAIRLQQFPLALFGIAIATAIFPALSRAAKNNELDTVRDLLQFGLMRSSCLMIPCTIGILLLGAPSINLLFGHGQFTEESTLRTTLCLWAYGLGLLPSTIVLLFSQAFYAQHDFKTPMYTSLATILLSTLFNCLFIFAFSWGATSVALSTSFTSLINAAILYFLYKKQHGIHFFSIKWRSLGQLSISTLVAGFACFLISSAMGDDSFIGILLNKTVFFPHTLGIQALQLILPSVVFALVFVLMSRVLHCQEVLQLLGNKR